MCLLHEGIHLGITKANEKKNLVRHPNLENFRLNKKKDNNNTTESIETKAVSPYIQVAMAMINCAVRYIQNSH